MQAIASELGVEYEGLIEIKLGASAANGTSRRIGSGKIRHIEVTQL